MVIATTEDGDLYCDGIRAANTSYIVRTDSGVYPPLLNDARLIAAAPDLFEALKECAGNMGTATAQTHEANRFLNAIRAMVETGKAVLLPREQEHIRDDDRSGICLRRLHAIGGLRSGYGACEGHGDCRTRYPPDYCHGTPRSRCRSGH